MLENALAQFCGARHAVTCASGTDALVLVLMAKGIGPGDAVFCPAFTFCATAEVAALLGATRCSPTSTRPPSTSIRRAWSARSRKRSVSASSRRRSSRSICSACRPITTRSRRSRRRRASSSSTTRRSLSGADYKGRPLGTLGDATATSFFPAKPLGCYGDGGAVFTDDDELAALLKSLRVHGHNADKYDNVRIGMTGRLDTIQGPCSSRS